MSVVIKLINGTQKTLDVSSFDISVSDLKKMAENVVEIASDEQRVVLRGKVLKDGDILSAVGMESGSTVHIVRSKKKVDVAPPPTDSAQPPTPSPAQQPAANPYSFLSTGTQQAGSNAGGGFGTMPGMTPDMMGMMGMGGAPNEQMLQQLQTPEMQQFIQMMAQNPAFLQYMQSSPQFANMPPEMVQLTMNMMANPEMLRLMMSASGNMNNTRAPNAGGTTNFGAAPSAFGMPPFGGMAPPQGNPRELYREQLQQLLDMGFPNEDANLAALQQSHGNISFAIERLING